LRCLATAALGIAVLTVLTACGSSPRRTSDDRNDAAAFVRAASRFQGVGESTSGEAMARVRSALDRCPPKVAGRRRQLVSQEVEEFLVPVRGQIALPDFRRLSETLKSVRAHDAGLREIASAAATITGEDQKLGSPPLDLCRFLKAWRAASWSRAFPDAYYTRLCRDADYGAENVARAEDRIQSRVLGLTRLGLSTRQQLDLYTSLLSPLFAICNVSR
jgi:hypothetical protein